MKEAVNWDVLSTSCTPQLPFGLGGPFVNVTVTELKVAVVVKGTGGMSKGD